MILLFVFFALWLGILFKDYLFISLLLIISLLVITYFKHRKKLVYALGITFIIGVSISYINISYPNKETYNGVVYEVHDSYYLFNSLGEKFYVYEKDTDKEIGDFLSIRGNKKELDFALIESSFDFEHYLATKGIYSALTVYKCDYKYHSFLKLNKIKKEFLSQFDDFSRGVISSLLFSMGENNELTNSIKDLHLAKFLSANGTYITIYLSILTFIFLRFFKRKYAEIVAICVLAPYLLLTISKFTIIKIILLYVLRWVNRHFLNKKFRYFTILGFVGIFFLLINKHLAQQTSFIIGMLAPVSFMLIKKIASNPKHKFKEIILQISLSFIFFIPLKLSFYNSLMPLSSVLQVLFTPIFLIIGLVSVLCVFKVPLIPLVKFLTGILSNILNFIKVINIEIYAPPFNQVLIGFYILIFAVFLYYMSLKFKPIYITILMFGISMGCFYLFPVENMITSEVNFINVGQGDSCLIRYQNTTVMIDTGGLTYKDIARDSLIPFLKKKRIYNIDLVITTHDDFDHSGALNSLIKNFKVRSYVNEAKNFPLKIGKLEFFNYNLNISPENDDNENSLVIGFKLNKTNYLIMGDAPIKVEKEIMKNYSSVPCDILKVGHHGSNTSSYYEFLKYVSPKEAIISCGLNNKFGHPHTSVVDSLKRLGIKIRRTDLEGTITYKKYIF